MNLPPTTLCEINEVFTLSGRELSDKYYDLFGERPSLTKPDPVRKAIAFRIQERFYKCEVAPRVTALKREVNVLIRKKEREAIGVGNLLPGTQLVRTYNNVTHTVVIRDTKTFEYAGRLFRSLSAIAKEITGTNWNGKRFFGVAQ